MLLGYYLGNYFDAFRLLKQLFLLYFFCGNPVKLITSRSRGVSSTYMLFIINSVIRSSLKYGRPLFFDSPPSALQILEVCYIASIHLATGLPRWTPLPVLRHEAGVSSITHWLALFTRLFLLRLLSSPPGLRLGETIRRHLVFPDPHWKFWGPLKYFSMCRFSFNLRVTVYLATSTK